MFDFDTAPIISKRARKPKKVWLYRRAKKKETVPASPFKRTPSQPNLDRLMAMVIDEGAFKRGADPARKQAALTKARDCREIYEYHLWLEKRKAK